MTYLSSSDHMKSNESISRIGGVKYLGSSLDVEYVQWDWTARALSYGTRYMYRISWFSDSKIRT